MLQDSILLVGSTDKGRALLQTLIPPDINALVRVVSSGMEARREANANDFSLVVINTPLNDESGLDLATELASATTAGVLLLVKAELAETVAVRVEQSGVLVIAKPVVRAMFDQAMRFARASRSRLLTLRSENEKLQKKMMEQRTIDRAKCMLIQYMGLTEEQAHRAIEKQAMDTRQTKIAVAKDILSTYEM